jgi:hypothetical protein
MSFHRQTVLRVATVLCLLPVGGRRPRPIVAAGNAGGFTRRDQDRADTSRSRSKSCSQ